MILVTGGTGYIGSHTCVELMSAGHDVVILDNLSNSDADVVDRIAAICGKAPKFVKGDIRDTSSLRKLFNHYSIHAVVHFAGLKAVGESVEKPLEYYDNNVTGTLSLLAAMQHTDTRIFIFSSSATVYGDPASVPIHENFPRTATNPYGRSKLIIEEILADIHHAKPALRVARLRYFNPVGAHESGLIGENPKGIPNNLMPFVAQVALGKREILSIFGNDYPTHDGTGIRDYIHVVDLACGHVAALDYLTQRRTLEDAGATNLLTVNLGTGRGYSVLEIVRAFEEASGRRVPFRFSPRRAGDIAKCWADPSLAYELLGWRAERDIHSMCIDAWRWQLSNHAS